MIESEDPTSSIGFFIVRVSSIFSELRVDSRRDAHVSHLYQLSDFFKIWQISYPDGVSVYGVMTPIIFNGTDVFGFRTGQGYSISLLIDREQSSYQNSSEYGSLVSNKYDYCGSQLPPTSTPCYPTDYDCVNTHMIGDPAYGGGHYRYGTSTP
jgi:hypothetical protein